MDSTMERVELTYEWATCCLNCGDGPRVHCTEEDARRVYQADVEGERGTVQPHRLQLLRRLVPDWENVTPPEVSGG